MTKFVTKSITVRVQSDILDSIDNIASAERVDRTTIVNKALIYWVNVNGQATTDTDVISRFSKIDTDIADIKTVEANLQSDLSECRHQIVELQKIILQQNALIDKMFDSRFNNTKH